MRYGTMYYWRVCAINNADTSGGSLILSQNRDVFSSTQCSYNSCWCMYSSGSFGTNTPNKSSNRYVYPVLEIPNTIS